MSATIPKLKSSLTLDLQKPSTGDTEIGRIRRIRPG
jgi:hypothetical protein